MKSLSEATSFATDLGVSAAGLQQLSGIRYTPDANALQGIAIMILALLFPNKTLLPNNAGFNASMSINWSTRAWLNPNVIFIPNSAQDVAKGIKIINFFSVPFAVRSGGHAPFPGSASVSGGILISLQNMTNLGLSDSKDVAYVGSGNRWINVYEYLAPFNLAVVGGRVPSPGVGGLTTGGGNSYFSTSHGMVCDNVASFEVVLADGSIVTASASENNDLFWALKGGSNNFGIVTQFNLLTISLPPDGVWGGNAVFTADKIDAVTDAIAEYQNNGQVTDPDAALIPSISHMGANNLTWFTVTVFHASGNKPASLDPIFRAGPLSDSSKRRTLPEMAREAAGGDNSNTMPPGRFDFRTISIGVSVDLYHEVTALFRETYTVNPLLAKPGYGATLTIQPVGASTVTQGNIKGGNAMGITEKAQTWLCLTSMWLLASDDEIMLRLSVEFMDKVGKLAKARGLLERYLFLNDAAVDQKVMESYGEEQVAKLREVSKKRDPDGVFQKLAKGGFKLTEN